MGNGRSDVLSWDSCPDALLIKVLRYLSAKELVVISNVNNQCYRVAYDELLWRRCDRYFLLKKTGCLYPHLYFSRFICDFGLKSSTSLKVHNSWSDEYKMLSYEVPKKLVQSIEEHTDEVLHVAFSPDGQLMSSCSKDCTLKVGICFVQLLTFHLTNLGLVVRQTSGYSDA
jgi:F-box/WD-40 domain protein 5